MTLHQLSSPLKTFSHCFFANPFQGSFVPFKGLSFSFFLFFSLSLPKVLTIFSVSTSASMLTILHFPSPVLLSNIPPCDTPSVLPSSSPKFPAPSKNVLVDFSIAIQNHQKLDPPLLSPVHSPSCPTSPLPAQRLYGTCRGLTFMVIVGPHFSSTPNQTSGPANSPFTVFFFKGYL